MESTVGEHLGKRTNRIDQIRLGAAVAVVFGHSWHISLGPDAVAPLERWLGLGVHELAVHVFFFLSGVLITQSAQRHADRPLHFAFARFKRIVPALWAHAAILPVILIACGVAGAEQMEALFIYAARLMTIFFVDFTVPGAFAANPFPEALNGSVWSLRHEIIVYALLGGAGALAALKTRLRTTIFVAVMVVWIACAHAVAATAQGGVAFIFAEGRWVMTSFLLGVLAHRLADWIVLRLDYLALVWGVAITGLMLAPAFIATHVVLVAVCYSVLILAFCGRPGGGLSADISYGVYIYGWPVQQLVVMAWISVFATAPAPLYLFVVAMPPLCAIAMLSWVVVERPALSLSLPFKRVRRAVG